MGLFCQSIKQTCSLSHSFQVSLSCSISRHRFIHLTRLCLLPNMFSTFMILLWLLIFLTQSQQFFMFKTAVFCLYYFQVNNAKPQIKSARARAAEERKTSGKQTNQNVSVQGTEILTPSTSSSTSFQLRNATSAETSSEGGCRARCPFWRKTQAQRVRSLQQRFRLRQKQGQRMPP